VREVVRVDEYLPSSTWPVGVASSLGEGFLEVLWKSKEVAAFG